MKLNKTEKMLLSVLIFLLVIVGYYKFIFYPQRQKLNNLTLQKEEYNKKLQDVNKKISSKSQKDMDIKILNAKIKDMTIKLFPDIQEEKFIVDVDKLLTQSNLKGISFTFSDIKSVPVEEIKEDTKDDKNSSLKNVVDEYNGAPVKKNTNTNTNTNSSNSKKTDDKNKPSAQNISLGISFKGNYKDLIQFVKNVENYSKTIIISNLQISQDTTGGVMGNMQLEFYAIPKITDEDKDFFKWDINNAYGKENPFDAPVTSTSIGTNSTIEEAGKVNKEEDFDFVMSVRAINSDLPTVMLGKAKDANKTTYVYADNPQIENIEVYFTKQGDKYYYKYKTSRDSYPAQFDGNGAEFTPSGGNINFKIYSNKRINDSDVSGANIKIYNKTDKTVNVSVDTDDNTKPRVSVSGDGGTVNVTRN